MIRHEAKSDSSVENHLTINFNGSRRVRLRHSALFFQSVQSRLCIEDHKVKITLSVLMVLITSLGAAAQEAFELPTDKETPVLTFDYSGGFRVRPPEGFVKKPQLQIFPDGRVLRSPNGPNLPSSEIMLSEEQMNAFLESVVNDHKFYEIEPEKIRTEIEKSGDPLRIADAPNLDITINLGQGTHEVSVYAVSFAAQQHPDIKSLADLAAIEKTCRRLLSITDLGGFENLETAIATVNAKLKVDYAEAPEMTVENLQYASKNQGIVTAAFMTTMEEPEPITIRVTFKKMPDGTEEAQINAYPTRR